MDAKTKTLIKNAEAKANKAAQDWIKSNEPDIERRVRALLNHHVQEIVVKLLGFDHHWGEDWELDHCNGRSGESAAGDWLRKRAGEAVDAWLDQQAQALPNLPTSAVKSLRDEYARIFEREVRRLLSLKAVAAAQAEVERLCTDWKEPKIEEAE